MERILPKREWLAADRFTVVDLLMADVFRIQKIRAFGDRPATEAYLKRVTGPPPFREAYADHVRRFEEADSQR